MTIRKVVTVNAYTGTSFSCGVEGVAKLATREKKLQNVFTQELSLEHAIAECLGWSAISNELRVKFLRKMALVSEYLIMIWS